MKSTECVNEVYGSAKLRCVKSTECEFYGLLNLRSLKSTESDVYGV